MEYFRNLVRAHVPRPQPEPPPQVPAQTMAELAKDVYRAPGETPSSTGFRRLGEEELREKGIDPQAMHTKSGMQAELYANDSGQHVLSFRGTVNPSVRVETRPFDGPSGLDIESDMLGMLRGHEYALKVDDVRQSGQDWVTNLKQGLGIESQQHKDAVALGNLCNEAIGRDQLMVTGHSKGGGQAQLVSAMFGNHGMTFNSAGLHDETLRGFQLDPERVRERAPQLMTSVVTRGEILDSVQGREFRTGEWMKAALRGTSLGEYGEPQEVIDQLGIDGMTTRVPTAMGKRHELTPQEGLGSVKLHTMDGGVLPYVSQLQGLSVGPAQQQASTHTFGHMPMGLGMFRSPLFDDTLLHGRFAQAFRDLAPRDPLLNDERHPMHGLYTQALAQVREHRPDDRGSERIAGVLTVAAQSRGLERIDALAPADNGNTLFAVQGRVGDPAARITEAVDVEAARWTTLEDSSRRSAELHARQPQERVQDEAQQVHARHH